LNRISGQLLDRIDIPVEVPAAKFREITAERTGETSAQIRERVVAARRRQQERFAGKRNVTCNARMGTRELKAFCALDEALTKLSQEDPDLARILNLRYFAGMTVPELAAALGVSPSTIDRQWVCARAWLFREITEGK
jgi:RNA polymerase sigma factor (sigma-70 family)